MKFLKETTAWPDATPNHTYLVDDSKTYMHGYVPSGTDVLKMFRGKIQISVSRRRFQEVPNTFDYQEPVPVNTKVVRQSSVRQPALIIGSIAIISAL